MNEDLVNAIAEIINDTVDIAEGNYGWGGQQYLLVNKRKAAKQILELLEMKACPDTESDNS